MAYFTGPTYAAATLLVFLSGCAPSVQAPARTVSDGESLIRAMHARHHGDWFQTVTFTQTTWRRLPSDSVARTETWLEWKSLPGQLRVQMGEASDGLGVIYAKDSTYVIRNHEVVRRLPRRSATMILGSDVNTQPPERTLQALAEEGYPLAPFRTDVWQGRPVYVVGAAKGDLRSKQFWVDQERLLFVRLLEPYSRDTAQVLDTRFNAYRRLDRGWIAPEVEVLLDGAVVLREEYSDIRTDVPVSPVLFEPDRWSEGVKQR